MATPMEKIGRGLLSSVQDYANTGWMSDEQYLANQQQQRQAAIQNEKMQWAREDREAEKEARVKADAAAKKFREDVLPTLPDSVRGIIQTNPELAKPYLKELMSSGIQEKRDERLRSQDIADMEKKRAWDVEDRDIKIRHENLRQKAELDAKYAKKANAPELSEDQIKYANTLRDDFRTESKDFEVIENQYQIIDTAEETGAGDMGIVFGYMKMLDPNSVVRESEYATAQNAAGVPESVRARYNALIGGGQLSTEQRRQFKSQARKIYSAKRGKQVKARDRYDELARKGGIDPINVYDTRRKLYQSDDAKASTQGATRSDTDILSEYGL